MLDFDSGTCVRLVERVPKKIYNQNTRVHIHSMALKMNDYVCIWSVSERLKPMKKKNTHTKYTEFIE